MYSILIRFRISLLLPVLVVGCALSVAAQSVDSSSVDLTKEKVYTSSEVSRAAAVIEKPKVEYRKEAQANDVDGVVVINLVLTSGGKVMNVVVAKGLSLAQDNAAIWAAKQIKFIPAAKDGEPVSQSLTVEYPFHFMLVENGSVSELRGIGKIYIDAGTNLEDQRNITGEVLKYLPKMMVVDTADEAEVILAFNGFERTETGKYVQKDVFSGEVKGSWNTRLDIKVGHGQVLRRVTSTHLRTLMKFDDPQWNRFERKPSINFARAFVKAYKQANGLEDE
ncbi:MAG TPA: energy transducer TonB [Pyrinomonadaceae bacterium]|jgi:TonB family protein|nr:energy transducer TonB [Pyrinomonadaceae bacterium]